MMSGSANSACLLFSRMYVLNCVYIVNTYKQRNQLIMFDYILNLTTSNFSVTNLGGNWKNQTNT